MSLSEAPVWWLLTSLAKLKIIGFTEKYLGPKWAELRFLETPKDRGSMFLPKKHWADHQHTSPNICWEIFSQLGNVTLESPHAESFQKQHWCPRVHLAASESLAGFVIRWRVPRKAATAVHPVQGCCSAVTWANTSRRCPWSRGWRHCWLVIPVVCVPAGCTCTKASGLHYLLC